MKCSHLLFVLTLWTAGCGQQPDNRVSGSGHRTTIGVARGNSPDVGGTGELQDGFTPPKDATFGPGNEPIVRRVMKWPEYAPARVTVDSVSKGRWPVPPALSDEIRRQIVETAKIRAGEMLLAARPDWTDLADRWRGELLPRHSTFELFTAENPDAPEHEILLQRSCTVSFELLPEGPEPEGIAFGGTGLADLRHRSADPELWRTYGSELHTKLFGYPPSGRQDTFPPEGYSFEKGYISFAWIPQWKGQDLPHRYGAIFSANRARIAVSVPRAGGISLKRGAPLAEIGKVVRPLSSRGSCLSAREAISVAVKNWLALYPKEPFALRVRGADYRLLEPESVVYGPTGSIPLGAYASAPVAFRSPEGPRIVLDAWDVTLHDPNSPRRRVLIRVDAGSGRIFLVSDTRMEW